VNLVVYSALFGDKDPLWSPPPVAMQGARYVLFTERYRREVGLWSRSGLFEGSRAVSSPVPAWEQQVVEVPYGARRTARYYKTMSHKVLPDADVTVWIDSNIRLLITPRKALKRWLKDNDLLVFRHPDRKCLFQEARVCLEWHKGDSSRIRSQVEAYEKEGMPYDWGLASTRCVIRTRRTRVLRLNEAWWKEIQTYSVRDQISLPYVCWKLGMRWGLIPGKALCHDAFWFTFHGQ